MEVIEIVWIVVKLVIAFALLVLLVSAKRVQPPHEVKHVISAQPSYVRRKNSWTPVVLGSITGLLVGFVGGAIKDVNGKTR